MERVIQNNKRWEAGVESASPTRRGQIEEEEKYGGQKIKNKKIKKNLG
jgi:hypothetical protein